ncbi:unnamed protein product [Hapterophycus canaliculatus]
MRGRFPYRHERALRTSTVREDPRFARRVQTTDRPHCNLNGGGRRVPRYMSKTYPCVLAGPVARAGGGRVVICKPRGRAYISLPVTRGQRSECWAGAEGLASDLIFGLEVSPYKVKRRRS